jgi:hypothetical protein
MASSVKISRHACFISLLVFSSACGNNSLVVKYLLPKQMSRVRFPVIAFLLLRHHFFRRLRHFSKLRTLESSVSSIRNFGGTAAGAKVVCVLGEVHG